MILWECSRMNTKILNVRVFFSFDSLDQGYKMEERKILKDLQHLSVYIMVHQTTHRTQHLDPYEVCSSHIIHLLL